MPEKNNDEQIINREELYFIRSNDQQRDEERATSEKVSRQECLIVRMKSENSPLFIADLISMHNKEKVIYSSAARLTSSNVGALFLVLHAKIVFFQFNAVN
jgi:hypothetical protein